MSSALISLLKSYIPDFVGFSRTEQMLRRIKEEHTKQKTLNQTLQAELDGSRSGSELGSRTRLVNGRMTPLSDDGHHDALRSQLVEAQRNAQRATAETQELHRQVRALKSDLDQFREKLALSQRDSESQMQHIEELEGELERLHSALTIARSGKGESLVEQLTNENIALKRDNDLLQQRIGLLLDVDQPGNIRSGDRPMSGRPGSHSSSENAIAYDTLSNELDDWLANSSTSHRPLSEYDSEPHRPAERTRARA